MPSGIDIAPIKVRILEQQLQLAGGREKSQASGQAGARGLPVLGQGEIIPARVLENMGPGRYLVLIKDTPFIADSHISLTSGTDITVRVEQTAPEIRLALVQASPENQANQTGKINEYLRWQRANPDGLRDLLAALAERLVTSKSRDQQNARSPGTAKDAPVARNPQTVESARTGGNSPGPVNTIIRNAVQLAPDPFLAILKPDSAARLLELITRLHYSGGTREGNWVRSYARDLGLTVEGDMLKVLEGRTDVISALKEHPDLKRALGEVSQLLQAEDGAAPGVADRAGLRALIALVDSGIKSIEALQVANVAMQDTQGPCAFQVPIVFDENRGTAHLFVESGDQEVKGNKGTIHKILLLLDLDRLGAMRVEASLAEGRLDCLFRCETRAASDLVNGGLDCLKESLEAAGCRVSTLGCIADGNIRGENQVSLNERLGIGESLSLFA